MIDNFLISLRDDIGGGKPGTKVGDTNYMDIPPNALTYNLQDKSMNIPADQWRHRLRKTNESVLVFVHGFGDDAPKVLARHNSIAAYLPSDVSLVSFDWPAGDSDPKHPLDVEAAYFLDKGHAKDSAPRLLTDCLQTLVYGFDATSIHLFAHSMGAFLTDTAFQLTSDIKIGRVLMAAADDDRKNYANGSVNLANFLGKCADLTAYWSTEDQALLESVNYNKYIPLGLRGFPDIETPKKHGLQCTDYYNVYVKPTNKSPEFSHVWYILFQPTTPPPLQNDFYVDLSEVLHETLTEPTRVLQNMLRSISPSPS